jgi:hypothetical protein
MDPVCRLVLFVAPPIPQQDSRLQRLLRAALVKTNGASLPQTVVFRFALFGCKTLGARGVEFERIFEGVTHALAIYSDLQTRFRYISKICVLPGYPGHLLGQKSILSVIAASTFAV